MANPVEYCTGGISGLRQLLKEHEGAVNFDLMARGHTVWDIGRTLSWTDFRDFINWLPPTQDSAFYRSRKPKSWWVTPQLQYLAAMQYVLEAANWQRGGGTGEKPEPPKFPEDRDIPKWSNEDLSDKRLAAREHLRKRREQEKKR